LICRPSDVEEAREKRDQDEERDMGKKRDLFDELVEGFDALADHRAGKRKLRMRVLKAKRVRKITARELAMAR
jgi:putative transcriptional regulator